MLVLDLVEVVPASGHHPHHTLILIGQPGVSGLIPQSHYTRATWSTGFIPPSSHSHYPRATWRTGLVPTLPHSHSYRATCSTGLIPLSHSARLGQPGVQD